VRFLQPHSRIHLSRDHTMTVSQSQDHSSDPGDPDAVVAQPLEQFQSLTSGTDRVSPPNLTDTPQPAHQITPSSEEAIMSFEIAVPVVDNPEEYDYLPGHFEAHRVLAVDMQEPKLIVRLKSGECQTVSAYEWSIHLKPHSS
jgi:chromodomain-helicase-DNA-binding protein 4